jgi:predicted DNA repair protein MutK
MRRGRVKPHRPSVHLEIAMSSGLFALLDDVAALAKVAAAALDDAATQATKAGAKAAGIVIDDAAVTPRYAVGFAAERELPIIWRIALGSLKNKLLFLLPAALVLGLVAPWAITPLLMAGGAYLCFEGFEKVYELVVPHAHHDEITGEGGSDILDAKALEEQKISGAIKTDFILSAEIMAIALATISASSFWMQALVLAVVGLGMTALVYGAVALIVKADDAGVVLARSRRSVIRVIGRGLVAGMPHFLKVLSAVGTAAMLWVGGGIILHGFAAYGLAGPEHLIHAAAVAVGQAMPVLSGMVEWLTTAAASAVVGLAIGWLCLIGMHYLVEPALKAWRSGTAKTVAARTETKQP